MSSRYRSASEEEDEHYFNRDSLFWRIADQYGILYRNVIWNAYLQGTTPQQQFISSIVASHVASEYRLKQMSTRLSRRHYFETAGAAFQHYANWVKHFFLPVAKVKVFVNRLFELLDWCLEQESHYNLVIVDAEIGRQIIAGAAKMCFRFADSDEKEQKANEAYTTGIARTHIQDVIRNVWQKDLYPNWETPTEGYMESHGQFLQSIFNHGDSSCVSQLYKSFCATQRLISEKSRMNMSFSVFQSDIRGEFAENLKNTMQIVEPFFEPEQVTTYYDVKEGDQALRGFVSMFVLPESRESRKIRNHFMYTLYLSGYGDHFALKMSRLDKDFQTSHFGKRVDLPKVWKMYKGHSFNKVPIKTWRALLQIEKFAHSTEFGDEKGGETLEMIRIKKEPGIIQKPQITRFKSAEPTKAPKEFVRSSVPRASMKPLRITSKRKRGVETEDPELPVLQAQRRRSETPGGVVSVIGEPGRSVTQAFRSPELSIEQNSQYALLAGIGVLALGAVIYTRGRA